MVTKDYSKSRMRENCTYGSVRGGQSNLIPSTRLKGWWYRPAGDEFYSTLGGHRPPLEASPLHHFVVPLPPQAVGGKA